MNKVNECYLMMWGVTMGCMARKMVGIRLDPALQAQVQALADAEERTFSWMAERLISDALKARGHQPEAAPQRRSSSVPNTGRRPSKHQPIPD
jgi:hypothetical protein